MARIAADRLVRRMTGCRGALTGRTHRPVDGKAGSHRRSFVAAHLTPDAAELGLSVALPERVSVAMASPAGVGAVPGSPSVSLTDLDGAPMALADSAGRPIWIIFWKTYCPPCQEEAADVAAAYAAHRADRLVVLGIDAWGYGGGDP